jgi:hypothetical protein
MHTTLSSQATEQQQFVIERAESRPEQVFVRSKTVVSRRIAGETLIVPVRGKVGDLASIYSFNATGSLLWETLATPQGLSGLIDAVQREYAVEREQAERDVKQFLKDTESVGLVEARQEVSMAAMQHQSGLNEYGMNQCGTDTPVRRF